jgi:hypothetical protein
MAIPGRTLMRRRPRAAHRGSRRNTEALTSKRRTSNRRKPEEHKRMAPPGVIPKRAGVSPKGIRT